jgi:hypothetical protein
LPKLLVTSYWLLAVKNWLNTYGIIGIEIYIKKIQLFFKPATCNLFYQPKHSSTSEALAKAIAKTGNLQPELKTIKYIN